MSDICSFHAITSVNKSGTELTSATSILTTTYCFNTGKIDRFQFSIWTNSLSICRHYFVLWMLLTIGMPTFVPYLFWNETLWVAYWMNLFRYCINFSHLGLSNTISHYYGARPYDNRISARDNDLMNIWTFGEGSHNFHHVFSRDYRTSEFEGWFVIVSFNLIDQVIKTSVFCVLGEVSTSQHNSFIFFWNADGLKTWKLLLMRWSPVEQRKRETVQVANFVDEAFF